MQYIYAYICIYKYIYIYIYLYIYIPLTVIVLSVEKCQYPSVTNARNTYMHSVSDNKVTCNSLKSMTLVMLHQAPYISIAVSLDILARNGAGTSAGI